MIMLAIIELNSFEVVGNVFPAANSKPNPAPQHAISTQLLYGPQTMSNLP